MGLMRFRTIKLLIKFDTLAISSLLLSLLETLYVSIACGWPNPFECKYLRLLFAENCKQKLFWSELETLYLDNIMILYFLNFTFSSDSVIFIFSAITREQMGELIFVKDKICFQH